MAPSPGRSAAEHGAALANQRAAAAINIHSIRPLLQAKLTFWREGCGRLLLRGRKKAAVTHGESGKPGRCVASVAL